jgi:hypothetical protein
VSLSQFKSQLRQMESRQRQAINNYNAAVRRFNTSIDNYNREARAHNTRVRTNQRRLQSEIRKLASRPTQLTTRVTYRVSVQELHTYFQRVDAAASRADWTADNHLVDLAELETANSVTLYNALNADQELASGDESVLRQSTLGRELSAVSADLAARWEGALFSLSVRNPEAARHFCTSSREILTTLLDTHAPDSQVRTVDPSCEMTEDGRVTRRSKIQFLLRRRGNAEPELVDFVTADIDNVITLFTAFNTGTHGTSGEYSIPQLAALKDRVEDAVQFLNRVAL